MSFRPILVFAASHAPPESWELGTAAQALLEIDAPSWSVFSRNSLPPPQQVPSEAQSSVAPVFNLAQEIVGNRSRLNRNAEGPQPLMADASAADPAANGVSVLLANWTGQSGQDYAGAARDQLDFLLERVPRTDDGAISHREAEVQLWYVRLVLTAGGYSLNMTGATMSIWFRHFWRIMASSQETSLL